MGDTDITPNPANFVTLPGAGRRQQVLAVTQTYKADSDRTAGRLVCVEIEVPPGRGVPPHRHANEDESFYVLAGQVVIAGDDCGGNPIRLPTGSFFHGPRGRIHGFRNDTAEPAKILVFITPGTGIEAMFTGLADLTRQDSQIDPAAVAQLCGEYGIVFEQPETNAGGAMPVP